MVVGAVVRLSACMAMLSHACTPVAADFVHTTYGVGQLVDAYEHQCFTLVICRARAVTAGWFRCVPVNSLSLDGAAGSPVAATFLLFIPGGIQLDYPFECYGTTAATSCAVQGYHAQHPIHVTSLQQQLLVMHTYL